MEPTKSHAVRNMHYNGGMSEDCQEEFDRNNNSGRKAGPSRRPSRSPSPSRSPPRRPIRRPSPQSTPRIPGKRPSTVRKTLFPSDGSKPIRSRFPQDYTIHRSSPQRSCLGCIGRLCQGLQGRYGDEDDSIVVETMRKEGKSSQQIIEACRDKGIDFGDVMLRQEADEMAGITSPRQKSPRTKAE